ncbi:GvpL/GvpF family gas vesicle protein [Nonomuraea angiospora]|uniref:GvpL/GvpF family gas vesicle protein n=1 Tax=Nonomuraea angiospora TaxID=46172 RepID=UPI0029BFA3D2|nr:GvpL/GvpF family gas vesicle protein [Nonomuraea angiospora]MDX3102672.1 GvpL/GvpF family gas vesicle protein [Nonomuraea angiospora]
MAESVDTVPSSAEEEHTPLDRDLSTYVYGIVPEDVQVSDDARGVAGAPVRLVRHGKIAALVSEVAIERPLGTPDDLVAHQQLLDATAAEVPVLPLRFGAVLTDRQAVVDELLGPHHDEFLAALDELEGRAEFVVKGRYDERAVLMEVLNENVEAAQLRDEIRGKPEAATREARIRLGEVVNQAVSAKREADTGAVLDRLTPLSVFTVVREPSHERDAVHLALLVESDRRGELEKAVAEYARLWAGRIELELHGPLAPYDFVVSGGEGG